MDANDIINALNHVLDLGDQLDNAGGGVKGLTNGEDTTREVCKIELGQFLLYLANCSSSINDGQAAILNLVLGDGFTQLPAHEFKELSNTVSAPDPSNNATLDAFMQADMALSLQNGENSSPLTNILISIYKAFGQLLIAMNENTLAQSRYDRIISQMESRAALVGYSADEDDSSSSGSFEIDDDVLTQYTGDDTHVSVPDGITRIGDDAFSGKTEIQTITLPDSVTVIGESAFWHCDSLEKINLPEGITEIESDAFQYCDSLTSLEIPSTVDTIGGDAFLFCDHIKRIRIPSTLTDIGNDAFMYCSGLETVTVYGGRKTDSILDQLKEHFPEGVKIIWEGDEKKKSAPATTSKKASSIKGKNSSSGKYDDRVQFSLPDGYELVDEKDNDGNRFVKINVNPRINDDGKTVYENTFLINIQTPDGVTTGKSALDIIHENNLEVVVNRRFASDPEALLLVSSSTSSIFGVQWSINLIDLSIAINNAEAVSITCVKPKVGDDEESLQPTLDQLKTVWDSMTILGKKATSADMEIDSLLAAVTEKADADKEKGETPIDNHVRQDGNYLVVGDRWRMELPYGVRYRYKVRGEDEPFDKLNIDLDRRTIGHCFLGETLRQQEDASQSILLMLSINGGGFQKAKKNLRDDDVMAVQLGLHISGSGNSAFVIDIKEKKPVEIETRIVFLPPCEIDNLSEALEAIKNKDIGMDHPFGDEWDNYWKLAMRMAASVSPADEIRESIELAAPEKNDQGFTVQIPDGFKSLKIKDSTKVAYIPTSKKLTQADLKKLGDYPYCIIQDSGKLDLPEIDSDQQSPDEKALLIQRFCHMFQRIMQDVFAVPVRESMTDAGYKAIYLTRGANGFFPDVLMFANDGRYAMWQFRSYSGYSPDKLLHAAQAVFGSVHCGNDSEITPIAYLQVPDFCHEHFTLVSGGYTTRRDADFVGQPIRMLMEKCGRKTEEAYALMEIPNDDYTLDNEARRLAKVFRLQDGMFDPYTDTEAMIRLGMFSEAKMLHALRSLAWTVFCKADREGRLPESYSFEELIQIAKPLDTNQFNYSTESYCSGLCSHYDWRVFYVPDAYIDSDCESHTDLRQLCGKENRSGNTSFVVFGGLGGFSSMNRSSEIISRNEETLESLEALRKDLLDLLPVMRTLHDGFMKNRDRSEKLEGILAEALTAWCALAVAAKEPFYSEEANDSPEVDAGLDGPMEQPTDDFDRQTPTKKSGSSSKPTVMKRPACPVPKGEVLDLNGATVIEPGQFMENMTLRNIIIPEGVTEIGESAFSSCMALETVVLPKTMKKIGEMAFMSCRALRQVEIPEGVEEICDHAFGATNNLKEVYLPDSLQRVDRCIFGMGGDSPYATAHMSGKLAVRLQLGSRNPNHLSAIYARRYVIDGKGYENMCDVNWDSMITDEEITEAQVQRCAADSKERFDKYLSGDLPNAYEEYLDKDEVVTIEGKHFTLCNFPYDTDGGVIKEEIEKRGGVVHAHVVKKADYLVLYMDSRGGSYDIDKALEKEAEWRKKGATTRIISDYQLWQAIFGKTSTASAGATKKSASLTGTTKKTTPSSGTTKKAASKSGSISSTAARRKTQPSQLTELENTVNSVDSELSQASDRPLTAEERKTVQEAQDILENMQSQISSTSSALDVHQENLRKLEEEKQRRIEEAKKKGKSSHDEIDMLAVLLIEETLGQLNRDDSEFAQEYAEDFAAYNEQQLIRLRRKVMPTIHNASVVDSAKADMLARSLEDRFSISTANYFNVSTDWDFDSKGTAAIEATKLWYKPEELPVLRKRMEEHKEKTRQSFSSQLTAFRPEWSDFRGIRSDLHINVSTDSEPVPEAHNLFHVKMGRDLDVRISITNPALGYISIPVMNVFASCWKVSPEDIWNAALQNSIEDSRGQSPSSRSDAMAAKTKALSQIKPQSSTTPSTVTSANTAPKSTNTQSQLNAKAQTNPNAKRIKELEESIAALRREADSIGGLFGFVKRNKIKKEIEAQQRELEALKRQSH